MKQKSVVRVIRDSKNNKKPRFVAKGLEIFSSRKFLIDPTEHKKLDPGVKFKSSEYYIGYLSVISEVISVHHSWKMTDEKRLILYFLITSFTSTYSKEKDDLIFLLVHENSDAFNIEHSLNH